MEDARSQTGVLQNKMPAMTLVPFAANHCWVRDTGPVYVLGAREADPTRYSINFNFNEWGGKVVGKSGTDVLEWGQVWPALDAAILADNAAFARRVIDSEAPVV